ncbi:Fic family protein [Kocuria sp.]|uniref:Fic family protein n=1 Tax=Kocuria sp. TaxID=1871328 RepID=UPI0026DAFC77|nr:Fic family protein [Kocuria sp.]MDO4918978.1 Fic family protein [Kocuria sp.]
MRGTFDLAHLREIHRRLYQDVWEWAGQVRTVVITKGSSTFLHPSRVETAFGGIHAFLRDSALLNDSDISDEKFVEQASDLLEKVNHVHPIRAFTEADGRPFVPLIEEVLKPPLDGLSLLDEELYRASNPEGT